MKDGESLYGSEALPPTGGVTWQAKHIAFGLGAALLAYLIAGGVLIAIFQSAFGVDSAGDYFGQFFATAVWHVLAILCVYLVVKHTGGSWRTLGLRAADNETLPINGRILGATFGLSIAAHILVIVLVFLEGLTGIDWLQPKDQLPEAAFSYDWLIPLIGLSVVVTAPIAEELLFRGFLFGGLRRYMPMIPAAFLSGSLFSLLHFSPGLFIPFLFIGALFAIAYERTHSIFVPILTHFFFNLLSYLILVFVVH